MLQNYIAAVSLWLNYLKHYRNFLHYNYRGNEFLENSIAFASFDWEDPHYLNI